MTRTRTPLLVTTGVLGVLALAACGSDAGQTTGGVAVDGVAPAAGTSSSSTSSAAPGSETGAAAAAPVTALQVLEGTLQRDDDRDDDDADDRYDDFTVNGVDVDFGPSEWIAAAGPLQDYDGDGTAEPFGAELDGLVGQTVSLQVRDDDDDDADDAGEPLDDADVYEVNGLALRDLTGTAPWRGGQVPAGPLAG